MRKGIASFLSVVAACCAVSGALAQPAGNTAVDAAAFLDGARLGQIPAGAEVILNVSQMQKTLTGEETATLLKSCHEGPLSVQAIYNRDGSVSADEATVMTKFSCDGALASYTGAAGVILFKGGNAIRLIIQVDGYAAAFPRKAG